VLLEEVCELDKIPPPLLWGNSSPCPFEGLAGDGNGMVDIFLCSFVDGCDGLLGGGVDALKCLPILALDEFVVDESVAVMGELRILWWGRILGGAG